MTIEAIPTSALPRAASAYAGYGHRPDGSLMLVREDRGIDVVPASSASAAERELLDAWAQTGDEVVDVPVYGH